MSNARLTLPIRRQHVVSRVVLRRFMADRTLSVHDREVDSIYRKGLNGVFHDYLDRHDSWAAEQRWAVTEAHMPRVYDLIDQRAVLDDADAIETLRDLLAVHWIRTPGIRALHRQLGAQVAARSRAKYAQQPDFLVRAFTQRTGLQPTGVASLEWINAQVHATALHAIEEEEFSSMLARAYSFARAVFARRELQIAYTRGADLMIGDAPVLTLKTGHTGTGPHQGVALAEAKVIVMPLSPTVLIGLGPQPATIALTDDEVRSYNSPQIQAATRWIGCHPGGLSDRWMRATSGAKYIRS